ncbi:MAG: efflux RND transporter periplasmic adaptor subunit [Immundisolibacterales bacterium]|nr:efflux RND transporter periplasmic adaptor subunit [Immundisolibacterales bacterium]
MRSAGHLSAGILALVLVAPSLFPAAAQSRRPPALVEVDAVREEPIAQTAPVVGRVVPREHGTVAATIGGPVAEVAVRIGDRVQAGDVLIVLARDLPEARLAQKKADESLEAARVRTAEAEVDLVRQELERLERLKNSSAFPKAAFEDKRQELVRRRSRVREAAAALARAGVQRRMAEIELERITVRAPYPGVVTARRTAPGGYVKAGDPVVTLVDDQHLEVEADVPADRLAGLSLGTEVNVELDDGIVYPATVRAIVPDENPLTRTRPVRFTPRFDPGPDAVRPAPNQSVVVRVPIAGPEIAASVHKDAVVSRGGRSLVYVVEGAPQAARAEVRAIRIGESAGGRFVVTEGLDAGELVVVRGNERINPGQAIRYKPRGAAAGSGPLARSGAGPREPAALPRSGPEPVAEDRGEADTGAGS